MKINKKQFEKIKNLMPIERKPAKISIQQFLNGLLYIVENGCKWRALQKKFGNWHTIYVRFNRWAKNGTIQRIFEELQKQNIRLPAKTKIWYNNKMKYENIKNYEPEKFHRITGLKIETYKNA